jgi:hypothetical protein
MPTKLGYVRAAANNPILPVFLLDSTSTVGAGKTGLTYATAGLRITYRRELAATVTECKVDTDGNVEDITTLGTYAAPSANKCRFKLVNDTIQPGMYEIHLAQAVVGTADASRYVSGCVYCTGVAPCPFTIPLTAVDLQTNLIPANLTQILGSAITGTAAQLVAAFTKFFNVAAPTATCLSLPDAVPGANGGLPTTNGTKVSQTVDLTAGQIVFKKNVARANFVFPMFDSTGALKTGLTVTAVIRKDAGASFAALAGSVTEIGATGWYTVDWAQAETNADTIAFSASAAGANPTTMTILTQA